MWSSVGVECAADQGREHLLHFGAADHLEEQGGEGAGGDGAYRVLGGGHASVSGGSGQVGLPGRPPVTAAGAERRRGEVLHSASRRVGAGWCPASRVQDSREPAWGYEAEWRSGDKWVGVWPAVDRRPPGPASRVGPGEW